MNFRLNPVYSIIKELDSSIKNKNMIVKNYYLMIKKD